MNTPICDFVRQYSAREPMRLHMPGHKGQTVLGAEPLDITEIPGADVLYHAEGIILESEENAASLFGTKKTLYSAEGSSLPIRAMLYLASLYAARQGKKPLIAAGRNAHKVFITAAALLDVQVQWLYGDDADDLVTCALTSRQLESYLTGCAEKPTAVYLTSPDYLGNRMDIATMARVCHDHGCLLLVDNAHGAYLNFLEESLHPMALGADLCCDSAHKTLPVLTGGAYLHVGKAAPALFAEAAESAMALFASTSPSYLILQSLDQANAYLADGFREKLKDAVQAWDRVKDSLKEAGWVLTGQEPLKLTILPKARGYTGEGLAELLETQNIFCEFADPDHLVLMLPVEFGESLPGMVEAALLAIPRRTAISSGAPALHRAEAVLSPHEALFRPYRMVSTREALGKIMADPTVSCPPAIPVVSCGERIEQWAVDAMDYYGINRVRVIMDNEVTL